MPRYQLIRGDENIVDFLQTVRTRAATDQMQGATFLNTEILTQVETVHTEFAAQVEILDDLLKQRRAAVVEAEQSEKMLKLRLRAAWKEVKTRVKEGLDSEALYAHYEMTTEGKSPRITKRRGWITLATEVVAGIGDAQAAGFEPVDVYDALQNALHDAQTDFQRLSDIKEAVNIQRNHLDTLRPGARKLCKSVVRDLRYFLAEETPSRQREIMRAYGVEFSIDSKEKKKAEADPSSQKSTESGQPASDASTGNSDTGNSDTGNSSTDFAPEKTTDVANFARPSATNGNGVTQHTI